MPPHRCTSARLEEESAEAGEACAEEARAEEARAEESRAEEARAVGERAGKARAVKARAVVTCSRAVQEAKRRLLAYGGMAPTEDCDSAARLEGRLPSAEQAMKLCTTLGRVHRSKAAVGAPSYASRPTASESKMFPPC